MSSVSTFGQNKDNIYRLNQLQQQLGDLQIQLATGKKAQLYKGLEGNAVRSQRARANFSAIETYMSNIERADRRIEATSRSIEEFQAQAANFATAIQLFIQEGKHQQGKVVLWDDPMTPENDPIEVGMDSSEPSEDFKILQNMADSIFDYMVELLNDKDGERYLFSGAQTLSKPIVNTGLLTTTNNSLIKDWKQGSLSNSALVSALKSRDTSDNPRAVTDAAIGYAPEISSGNTKGVFVRADDNAEFDYTIMANAQGFRDILVIADFIRNENYPPLVDEVDPNNPLVVNTQGAPGDTVEEMQSNFFAVFHEMAQMVDKALDSLDTERFKLEQVRANMGQIKEDHQLAKKSMLDTISEIEDADMNEVALTLNFLTIRMEASYRVTSTIKDLTLVNYI